MFVMMIVLSAAGEGRAQYGYPSGYGPWAGRRLGLDAREQHGRGLGMLSMGRGMYNERTAEARSINANTAMTWNNYVYRRHRRGQSVCGTSRAKRAP